MMKSLVPSDVPPTIKLQPAHLPVLPSRQSKQVPATPIILPNISTEQVTDPKPYSPFWSYEEECEAGPEWRRVYKTLISRKKGFQASTTCPILFGLKNHRKLYLYQILDDEAKEALDKTHQAEKAAKARKKAANKSRNKSSMSSSDDSDSDTSSDDQKDCEDSYTIYDRNPNLSRDERHIIMSVLYDPNIALLEAMGDSHTGLQSLRSMYRIRNYIARNNQIYMRVYLNVDLMDKCLRSSYPYAPSVIQMIMDDAGIEVSSNDRSSITSMLKTENIPVAKIPQIQTGLEWVQCMQDAKTPFEYQKANIDWMHSVEKNHDLGFNQIYYLDKKGYRYLRFDKTPPDVEKHHGSQEAYVLYQDLKSNILLNEESLWNLQEQENTCNFQGGILCDEVGLGKTLSMVGLILKNPVLPTRFVQPLVKAVPLIKLKALPPLRSPIALVETTKVQPEPDGPRLKPLIRPILKKPVILPTVVPPTTTTTTTNVSKGKKDLLRSSATLVLAPSRLCQQWEDEIESYVKPIHYLRVLKITTIVQLRHYEPRDLQNADIVIVSYPFLANKNYHSQDLLKLDQIHWHRIILDEGHEVLYPTHRRILERTISKTILELKATYKWCCTGDPLAKQQTSFDGILMYLTGIPYGETRNGLLLNLDKGQVETIFSSYFRRNTKKSTKDMIVIPAIQEKVEFLEFTDTEKAIYDNVSSDDIKRRLQLCTNILISDKDSDIIGGKVVNMENINESMKEHYVQEGVKIEEIIADTIKTHEEWMAEFPKVMQDIESRLAAYTNIIMQGGKLSQLDMEDYEELKDRKPKMKTRKRYREKTIVERLANLRADLHNAQSQVRIFTELNATSFKDKPCDVCCATISETNPLVLNPCGHMNCSECVELLFNNCNNAGCPYCRKVMTKNSLQTVAIKKKKAGGAGENPVLDRWGTKMAYLTQYLQDVLAKDDKNRVILFSQWNRMLHMVGMVLDDANISHVFCRGNVHTITKSIGKFKRDPRIRVIMLSSESCSSGNNLTEASHIVLLDTPNMDKEAALAIENQAVGRAVRLGQARPVEVTRMIIKDTVEEEYYYRNHPPLVPKQP